MDVLDIHTSVNMNTLSIHVCFAGPLTDVAIDKVNSSGKTHSHHSKPMLKHTKEYLDSFFQPYNVKLANYLNDDRFLWSS